MVRWENDNRWRDGITSYIKMKIEINNESSRKCSGRPSAVLSVKKTVEAVGSSEVRMCGCAEGGRKTVPLQGGGGGGVLTENPSVSHKLRGRGRW